MTAAEFDLAKLLEPVGHAEFFSRYWEREPLIIRRGDPHYYASLVTLGQIESFISRGDARHPAIRLAKGGRFYAPEAYTRDFRYGDEVFHGVPDLQFVISEYNQGATLTLPAWHRSSPALGGLCARLEAELDHVVDTNVYLTPPGAAGFTPHYDTHDVFVLQVAGRKHWRVYEPPLLLPHRTQPFPFETYVLPQQPLFECELAVGDLLYLPRGHVHTTHTTDGPSAHVTIGVTVYTWAELLSEACQGAVERQEMRTALPPGFAHKAEARDALADRLPQFLRQLADDIDTGSVIARFVQRVCQQGAKQPIEFHADIRLTPQSRLQLARGISYSLNREQDSLILTLNGRRLRLQAATESAVKSMANGIEFTVQSLPDDISLEARLTLARYLVAAGFLRRA